MTIIFGHTYIRVDRVQNLSYNDTYAENVRLMILKHRNR